MIDTNFHRIMHFIDAICTLQWTFVQSPLSFDYVSVNALHGKWNSPKMLIDTVNQGNWCLSIKLRVECFVIVA